MTWRLRHPQKANSWILTTLSGIWNSFLAPGPERSTVPALLYKPPFSEEKFGFSFSTVIASKESQPANAPCPIYWTEEGIETEVKEEQKRKAPYPIPSISPRNDTFFSLEQSLKAKTPILHGMVYEKLLSLVNPMLISFSLKLSSSSPWAIAVSPDNAYFTWSTTNR